MTIENEDDRCKAAELYRRYGRIMLSVARDILGDTGLAEDAVSEAFVRIIENLGKINPENCYKTRGFVVIITRHTALNMLKQQKWDKTVPFEDYTDYSDSDEPVLDNITVREACSMIADAISGLRKITPIFCTLNTRWITLTMKFKILGISPENVRMRLSRARKALKDR